MSIIQQAITTTTTCQSPVLSDGIYPEKIISTTLEVGDTSELTKDNKIVAGTVFSSTLNQQFPRDVAILYVDREGEEYRVRGHNSAIERQLETELTSPPKEASFAQQVQGEEDIEVKLKNFWGTMLSFSQENSVGKGIRKWLRDLLKELKNEFDQKLSCIVICDNTEFEFPWELLPLSKTQCLGTFFVTVRWQDIQDTDDLPELFDEDLEEDNEDLVIDNAPLVLKFNPCDCYGDIVAYADLKDPEILEGVQEEVKCINKFKSHLYYDVYDLFNNLKEYETKIRSSISLIYIASHGFFGNDISQYALGEINNRISFFRMYEYSLSCLKKYHTIIFMNACDSGRLLKDNKNINNTDQRTGFATFFLKRGASGVIGTLSEVFNIYATKISQQFFEEYEKDPNRDVAEIIRYLKEQSLKNFLADKTTENTYSFVSTFMYIYYGNPRTKLKLIYRGE